MKKIQFVFVGIVMIIAVAFFITASIMKDAKRHFTIDELLISEEIPQEAIQVDGFVKTDSVKWKSSEGFLVFELAGKEDKQSIKVIYKNGTIPNNFQEEKGVVVEGIYSQAEQLIYATKLMTKCPSKYITENTENTQKESKEENF